MSARSKILTATACLLFVGYLVYSTLTLATASCEACVSFNGHEKCETAVGASEKEAIQTAVQVACASLAAGRTESIRCGETEPKSVRCD